MQWATTEDLAEHGLDDPSVRKEVKQLQRKQLQGLQAKKKTTHARQQQQQQPQNAPSPLGPPNQPSAAAAADAALEDIEEAMRVHILVHDSRNAFLVPDPTGLLAEGACFFQPTIADVPTVMRGKIMMVRCVFHAQLAMYVYVVCLRVCKSLNVQRYFCCSLELKLNLFPEGSRIGGGLLKSSAGRCSMYHFTKTITKTLFLSFGSVNRHFE